MFVCVSQKYHNFALLFIMFSVFCFYITCPHHVLHLFLPAGNEVQEELILGIFLVPTFVYISTQIRLLIVQKLLSQTKITWQAVF